MIPARSAVEEVEIEKPLRKLHFVNHLWAKLKTTFAGAVVILVIVVTLLAQLAQLASVVICILRLFPFWLMISSHIKFLFTQATLGPIGKKGSFAAVRLRLLRSLHSLTRELYGCISKPPELVSLPLVSKRHSRYTELYLALLLWSDAAWYPRLEGRAMEEQLGVRARARSCRKKTEMLSQDFAILN